MARNLVKDLGTAYKVLDEALKGTDYIWVKHPSFDIDENSTKFIWSLGRLKAWFGTTLQAEFRGPKERLFGQLISTPDPGKNGDCLLYTSDAADE